MMYFCAFLPLFDSLAVKERWGEEAMEDMQQRAASRYKSWGTAFQLPTVLTEIMTFF